MLSRRISLLLGGPGTPGSLVPSLLVPGESQDSPSLQERRLNSSCYPREGRPRGGPWRVGEEEK